MPLECVAIRKAAQNQTLSGRCARCITVPAVTEVSLPQVAQAKVRTGRQASRQAFEPPQPGQRKPAGQRVTARARRTPHRPENAAGTRAANEERLQLGRNVEDEFRRHGRKRLNPPRLYVMVRSYHAAGPKTTTRCAAGLNGMSLSGNGLRVQARSLSCEVEVLSRLAASGVLAPQSLRAVDDPGDTCLWSQLDCRHTIWSPCVFSIICAMTYSGFTIVDPDSLTSRSFCSLTPIKRKPSGGISTPGTSGRIPYPLVVKIRRPPGLRVL